MGKLKCQNSIKIESFPRFYLDKSRFFVPLQKSNEHYGNNEYFLSRMKFYDRESEQQTLQNVLQH